MSDAKVFIRSWYTFTLGLLAQHNLEQLCISISCSDTDTFLQSISAHGGLLHVVLSAIRLYDDGITTLIENSPNLITCHLYASVRSSHPHYRMNKNGTFVIENSLHVEASNYLFNLIKLLTIFWCRVTDIISFWSQDRYL